MKIRVRFRHPVTRGRRTVSVETEAEAARVRERIRDLRAGLRLGTISDERALYELRRLSPARRSRRTLRDAAGSWMRGVAPTTRKSATSLIEHGPLASIAGEPLEALDAERLGRWLRVVIGTVRDSSILAAWRVVSAIVQHAIGLRWLDVVPWGDWRPPRGLDATPRARECATTPEEVARLLAAAAELDANSLQRIPSYEARIALPLGLGLRGGEISGLRWSDCDEARALVTIARQYTGEAPKGDKSATLRAPAFVFSALGRYRARLERFGLYAPEGPVFPHLGRSRPGRPRHSPGAVLSPEHVRIVARAAGMPRPERWTVHSLRASFVCLELLGSGSVAHAMQRARHRSLRATQHYVRGLLELDPPAPAWELPTGAPALPPPTSTRRFDS